MLYVVVRFGCWDWNDVHKTSEVWIQNRSNTNKAPIYDWEYLCQLWKRGHVDFAGSFIGHNVFSKVDRHVCPESFFFSKNLYYTWSVMLINDNDLCFFTFVIPCFTIQTSMIILVVTLTFRLLYSSVFFRCLSSYPITFMEFLQCLSYFLFHQPAL